MPEHEVAVVGGGFSGIGMGIRLKNAGIDRFAIFEKAGSLGGTWRDNTYPGIAVDIASFTYSFSFEPNPDWSRVFAPGNELLGYAHHCTRKYGLLPHFRFGAAVERADFDRTAHLWRLRLSGGRTTTARFLVNATGGLTQPKDPDIPGLADFRGKVVHTARWDHGYDLRGKRVAVVGTGATAVQLVPSIAPLVSALHVFQRTPIWVLPKPDAAVPTGVRALFRRVPAIQGALRLGAAVATEVVMTLGVVYYKQTPWLVASIERLALDHLRAQVPDPDLRRRLTPQYGFGCKRPTFSNDYLRTFGEPHVELVTEPIERITEGGVKVRGGRERLVDTLVLATGFKVFERGNLPTYEVVGSRGRELGEFWESERYQAYEGATVPGFPNFFAVPGPYATTGTSWFAMIEAQTLHAMRCIAEARRRKATWVEVREEPHLRHFAKVLRRQKNTVFFNHSCGAANSYYFDKHGDAPFLRPSTGLEMHFQARHFPLSHYRFETR